MKEESRVFIQLINIAMHGYDRNINVPEIDDVAFKLNTDDNMLRIQYFLAKKHKTVTLLQEVLKRKEFNVSKDMSDSLMRQFAASLIQDSEQRAEAERLMKIFEHKEIPVIMLKGWVMKRLYPRTDLRCMADLDIFMNKEDEYKVHEIMLSNGYTCINFDHKKDNVYQKPRFLTIEMHKNLFKYEDNWNTFFKDIWTRSEKLSDYNYVYQMDKELYYVYMLAHMAKHLKDDGGIGVRAFLDLWVYRQHFGDELNEELIKSDLSKLGLDKFQESAEELAAIWFGQKECTDPLYEQMSEYIIECGAYGNTEFFVMNNVAMDENTGRYRYLLRRAFPNKREMELRFPKIKEKPFLILYFWFYRLWKYGLRRKKEVTAEITSTKDVDFEKMMRIKEMYGKIGLR